MFLLLWGRREGLEQEPVEKRPSTYVAPTLYDYTTTCEACTGSGQFWNKLKKVCHPTEQAGFEKSCV